MSEQTYQFTQALEIIESYVCAGCYGRLTINDDGNAARMVTVQCPECGERGLVTRAYADQKKAESAAEYYEAARNLEAFFPREKHTAQEILQDIGF